MEEELKFTEQECRIPWSGARTSRSDMNWGRAEAVSGRLINAMTQVPSKLRSHGNSVGKVTVWQFFS